MHRTSTRRIDAEDSDFPSPAPGNRKPETPSPQQLELVEIRSCLIISIITPAV